VLVVGRLGGWVPGETVGAVGVDAGRELGVEGELARRAELREVRLDAPADEQAAVAEQLGVALRRGAQAFRLVVGLDQRRDVGAVVELDGDGAAVGEVDQDVGPGVGGAGRVVVEERVDAVAVRLGVVLPGEDLARAVEDLALGRLDLE